MRKSNNYFKFLEYVTYGKDHDTTIDKGNGVLECKSYVSISDIEDMYKTTFGLENQWLTFKNILINEDTLYVYYLDGKTHAVRFHLMYIAIININQNRALKRIRLLTIIVSKCINT